MPKCSASRRMWTPGSAPRSKLCKLCWSKNIRGEAMNRLPSFAFRVAVAAILLSSGVSRLRGQTPATPPPAQQADKDKEGDEDKNPFAPEPAPKLPPGLYDAGEASMGIKHLLLLKKPDAFQLGASDPDDPKVQKTIGQLGIRNTSKMAKPLQLVIAQLAFSNSDLAFQGNHLFQGNFYGVNIYDIANPANTALLTS